MPRKPKPTNLKVLQGTARADRINPKEPKPEINKPEPPELLQGVALAEWERLSQELYDTGILTNIDRAGLAAYCQVYARWVEAEEMVKQTGLVVKTKEGNPINSPWLGVANRALGLMRQYITEFGMTPSSRTKVQARDSEEEDKTAKFFK